MDTKKLQLHFFMGLLVVVIVLTIMIFWSFLVPLALAFMTAIITRPVYKFFLGAWKGRKSLSALMTVLFVLIVILVPLSFLIHQVTVESWNFYGDIRSGNIDGVDFLSQKIVAPIHELIPSWNFDVRQYIQSFADGFVQNVGGIFSSASSVALNSVIAVVALFYMLRDGHMFRKVIVELSPLADTYDNEIIDKIEKTVNSVVRGSMFTSLLKGVLAAVGFSVFGVPHALLWGVLTAIVSLLPGIGAGLTIIPAVGYLVAFDQIGPAIGLAIWGTIIVGLVDNFVMPMLMRNGFQVHPLLVLLAVVGGMIFFGPIGLFLGPLIVSLLAALVEIYKLIVVEDKKGAIARLR